MIVPAQRMLLAAVLVVLPVATLAGIVPAFALPCTVILAVCCAAAVADALLSRQRVAAFSAGSPELVRLTKDVRADVTLTLENRSVPRAAALCRIGNAGRDRVRAPHRERYAAARPLRAGMALHGHHARRSCLARSARRDSLSAGTVAGARPPAPRLQPARLPKPARSRHGGVVSARAQCRHAHPAPGGQGPRVRETAPIHARR